MDDLMTELLLFSPTPPTTPRAPRPTNVSSDGILSRLQALEEAMETNARWSMASFKGLGLADRIEMLEAQNDFIQRDLADVTMRLESRMDKVEGRIDIVQHVLEDVNGKLEVVTRKADRLAWSVQIGDRHAAHVINRAEVINNKVEDLRGKVQGIEDRLVAVASRTAPPPPPRHRGTIYTDPHSRQRLSVMQMGLPRTSAKLNPEFSSLRIPVWGIGMLSWKLELGTVGTRALAASAKLPSCCGAGKSDKPSPISPGLDQQDTGSPIS
ncbi:hypothetical protein N7535_009132 [Penicillium sp. DV-2018c]|nr:hypothetical protein N7535_009132 [Penicillium sp. DV-2018c]